MSKTLAQILDEDLDLGAPEAQAEKIASEQSPGTDEIEKLAKETGLFDEVGQAPAQNSTMQKEAGMSMDTLYGNLWPEDQNLGATKVASAEPTEQEKVAAEKEAAIGARAYDLFAERFDARVTKLASEPSAQSGSVHHSSSPAQSLPTNKPANADQGMSTKAENAEGNTLKAKNDEKQVGHTEQKMASAMRKHLLLAQIDE